MSSGSRSRGEHQRGGVRGEHQQEAGRQHERQPQRGEERRQHRVDHRDHRGAEEGRAGAVEREAGEDRRGDPDRGGGDDPAEDQAEGAEARLRGLPGFHVAHARRAARAAHHAVRGMRTCAPGPTVAFVSSATTRALASRVEDARRRLDATFAGRYANELRRAAGDRPRARGRVEALHRGAPDQHPLDGRGVGQLVRRRARPAVRAHRLGRRRRAAAVRARRRRSRPASGCSAW